MLQGKIIFTFLVTFFVNCSLVAIDGMQTFDYSEKKIMYERYVTPIELTIYRLGYDCNIKMTQIISDLLKLREDLITDFGLESCRRQIFPDLDDYKDFSLY